MGNPFTDNSSDLIVLDSKYLADPTVIKTICQIEELRQEQHKTFVRERLMSRSKPLIDPIKKNPPPLFRSPLIKKKTKSQLPLTYLKNDCAFFSQLYTLGHKYVVATWMRFLSIKIERTHQH